MRKSVKKLKKKRDNFVVYSLFFKWLFWIKFLEDKFFYKCGLFFLSTESFCFITSQVFYSNFLEDFIIIDLQFCLFLNIYKCYFHLSKQFL